MCGNIVMTVKAFVVKNLDNYEKIIQLWLLYGYVVFLQFFFTLVVNGYFDIVFRLLYIGIWDYCGFYYVSHINELVDLDIINDSHITKDDELIGRFINFLIGNNKVFDILFVKLGCEVMRIFHEVILEFNLTNVNKFIKSNLNFKLF
jgi:hypothetical protein